MVANGARSASVATDPNTSHSAHIHMLIAIGFESKCLKRSPMMPEGQVFGEELSSLAIYMTKTSIVRKTGKT